MSDDVLRDVLARATGTVAALVGCGVLALTGKPIIAHPGPGPFKVVADRNTLVVAGEAVQESLCGSGAAIAEPLVFPGRPVLYTAQDNVDRVRDSLGDAVPVTVGADTLNDLVKLAAFELGRDHACVDTAASMDGYTGSRAPMSSQGVKATRACKAPAVIAMDLDVVAVAPTYLTISGYGDLVAKIPGDADWILAGATRVELIDPDMWRLVQSGVVTALSDPDALAAGQLDAFRSLMEGSCLSGPVMQAYGGIRPVSGAEYYFSHPWELAHLGADLEVPSPYGAKVIASSLAMCALYEALIGRDLSGIDADAVAARRVPWPGIEASIRSRLEGALTSHAVRETRSKYLIGMELVDRLRPLVTEWPEVTERLRAQFIPMRVLADRLRCAGAPSRPENIGVTRENVRALLPRVMYYRSRYTVLGVAQELGLSEDPVVEVSEKIWV